jgi:sortase (surface protein transpeptidase)
VRWIKCGTALAGILLAIVTSAGYSPARQKTLLLTSNAVSIVHHRGRHLPAPGIIVRPALPRRVPQPISLLPTRHSPWFVRIPSIGVNARLIVLGYPKSTYLPVPSLSEAFHVGWYRFSSVPGQRGNAVLVGHVDTYRGPAVFYNLYLLRPGDRIYIRLGTHGYAHYLVRSVREIPKSRFPADEVFGYTRARELWLITCGGPFDYLTHHYRDNIIVSADGYGQGSHKAEHSRRGRPASAPGSSRTNLHQA